MGQPRSVSGHMFACWKEIFVTQGCKCTVHMCYVGDLNKVFGLFVSNISAKL